MKKLFSFIICSTLFINCIAQIKNAKTETVKIYGNCGMCEATIEKAGYKKKIAKVDWNKDTQMATLIYDTKKTNQDEILKRIALSGYDSKIYLAPDDAYAKLADCCKYDRVEKKENKTMSLTKNDTAKIDHSKMEHSTVKTNTVVEQNNSNPLKQVYSLYFTIKDALIKDDGNLASTKAKELLTALNAVKMEALVEKEHTVFMKQLSNLKTDAGNISESKNVSFQREHFTSLSENIYDLMKVIKPSYTVYLNHCPMYNDGKGANWISKESAIKNPYYGLTMLTCGKVKETIK